MKPKLVAFHQELKPLYSPCDSASRQTKSELNLEASTRLIGVADIVGHSGHFVPFLASCPLKPLAGD